MPRSPTSLTASTMLSTRRGSMNCAELTSLSRSAVIAGSVEMFLAMSTISLFGSAISRWIVRMLSGKCGRLVICLTSSSVSDDRLSIFAAATGTLIRATVSPLSVWMSKQSSSRLIFLSMSTRMTRPNPAPSDASRTWDIASSRVSYFREWASLSCIRRYSVLVSSDVVADLEDDVGAASLEYYLDVILFFLLLLQVEGEILHGIGLEGAHPFLVFGRIT